MSPAAPDRRRAGHALYVAWGFPPSKSGGVFRLLETANVLIEEGWDVTVLACDVDDLRRFAGTDMGTLDAVDPRVRVVRVPMDLGASEPDLHRWSAQRVSRPRKWRNAYEAQLAEMFPAGVYALWEEPATRAALAVHEQDPVDIVLASGGPFVSFGIARNVHDAVGAPYVLDYRDSWSLQQFTDTVLHGPGSRVHDVESRLLAGAAEAWFVNDPMRQWHEKTYAQCRDRTRVVTNGFDAAALRGMPLPTPHDGPVRFGYLGTLTAAVPLEECLAGWRRARENDPEVARASLDFHGYLGFYPTPNPAIRATIAKAEDSGVAWRGAVPKAEVGRIYGELDVLVLAFGGTRYVTSGKVFEYMATGRPIVSVHAPENAVRDVLEGYPLWFAAESYAPADVARAFTDAAHAVTSGRAADPDVVAAALAHAARFDRRECLREGVAALPELVERAAAISPGRYGRRTATVATLDRVSRRTTRVVGALRRSGMLVREVTALDPSAGGEGVDAEHWAPAAAPGILVERRAERLRLAEPGTWDGRRRDLYTEVARRPVPGCDVPRVAPAAFFVEWLEAADRLVGHPSDIFWGQGLTSLVPVAWARAVTDGSRSAVDLTGVTALLDGPFAADRDDWLAVLGQFLPEIDLVVVADEAEADFVRPWAGSRLLVVIERATRRPSGRAGLRRDLGLRATEQLVLAPVPPTGADVERLVAALADNGSVHVVVTTAPGQRVDDLVLAAERAGLDRRVHLDAFGVAGTAGLAEVDAVLWFADDVVVPGEVYETLAAGLPAVARAGTPLGDLLIPRGLAVGDEAGLSGALVEVLGEGPVRAAAQAASRGEFAPDSSLDALVVGAVARVVADATPAPLRHEAPDEDADDGDVDGPAEVRGAPRGPLGWRA